MVSLTFPTTLSLLSLAAPPQRVSQVNASVRASFPCTTIPLRRVKTEFGPPYTLRYGQKVFDFFLNRRAIQT